MRSTRGLGRVPVFPSATGDGSLVTDSRPVSPVLDTPTANRPEGQCPAVSLVVPMHDEAANVAPLFAEIAAALENRETFEAVAVDDGSGDGTGRALAAAAARYPWLTALRHDRRRGKSAAVWTGALAARAPVLVLLDGDRQNDPAEVPALLARYHAARADDPAVAMLAGQRTRRHDTVLRRLSSRVANAVRAAVLRDGTRDTGCGLKVIDRAAFRALPFFDGQHRFMPALVRAQGGGVVLAPVTHRPRVAGQAKYGLWNRLGVGIVDLLGVVWLTRRCHLPRTVTRIDPAAEEDDPHARP